MPSDSPPSCAPRTAAGPDPTGPLLDVEVIGIERAGDGLAVSEAEQLCALALASSGLEDGHVAVELVESERIAELNAEHRGRSGPTDVLSFPVDEDGASAGPRELGDIVICPEHTADIREAVVHGALHLAGMDHETDEGEMLTLQREILSWVQE
jgi:probable rRNA maturation factor